MGTAVRITRDGSTAADLRAVSAKCSDGAQVRRILALAFVLEGRSRTEGYLWAPVGSRPLQVRDNRHDSAYIFGAICPQRGVGAAMLLPAANKMGRVRRPPVIVRLAWAVALCCVARSNAAESHTLLLDAHEPPGSLRISNQGSVAEHVLTTIGIEGRAGDTWIKLGTEFRAVADCSVSSKSSITQVNAGQTFEVQIWRGYSCSGQCHMICRANIYFGPGPFRFVVTTVPRQERVVSPEFSLPPRP